MLKQHRWSNERRWSQYPFRLAKKMEALPQQCTYVSIESMNGNSKVKADRPKIEYKIGRWLWYTSWMYQDRQESNYVTFEWTEAWHSQISKVCYSCHDQNSQFKMSGLHIKWSLNWVNKSMNGFLWNIKSSFKISWWLHYRSHFPHGLGDSILITGSVD